MNKSDSFFKQLKGVIPSIKQDEPLARHTTFHIGGPADVFAEVVSVAQMQALWKTAHAHKVPVFFIGQGTNVLVSDKGVRGVVAKLGGELKEVCFEDSSRVVAGAGILLPALLKKLEEKNLTGAEFMAGIPGSLGGGLMTNAGTKQGNLGDVVEAVEVLDDTGEVKVVKKEELGFSYRHSRLPGKCVLRVHLKLRREAKNVMMERIAYELKTRSDKQPIGTYNCGSVFKNPPNDFAGRLIESCGFKGFQIGQARVSQKHANFIENLGQASARDVYDIIKTIQNKVKEAYNIELKTEVWLLGEF